MTSTDTKRFARPYMSLVIAFGAIAGFFSIIRLNVGELGITFLLFAAVTLIFGSRITVQIPSVKGQISVSDTFIFLSILLFGGEAGIILASADAVISSLRFTKTKLIIAFNASVYLLSTFVTVWTLRMFFGSISGLTKSEYTSEFVIAICLMGFTQYIMNSGLVATGVALRSNQPIWKMWRDNFLWTSLTYFAGASAAAIIVKLIGFVGLFAILATIPIIAVVYITYTTYLKNVESAATQAELAQKHVEELSHYIAEQERISRALKESEEYFRTAFDHAAGMALVSPEGRWIEVNESLCVILGYTEQELLEKGFQTITHPDDLGNDIANMYKLLKGTISSYQLEKRYSHKCGQTVWVLQSASLIRDAENSPRHVIFQIQDISDRKKAEAQIHHAAFHDALTGLPNRSLFSDRLSLAVERVKRMENYKFAVLFVDLDRFKVVNDSLGHDMGDKLLIDLSRRLERCLRKIDTVARLGGDEFAILLDDISSVEDVTEVVSRIQQSLEMAFYLEGHEFFTTVSIGVAYSMIGYDRPEDILRDADTAMYRAKAKGKARHEVFDIGMHKRAVEALTLENELRRAIENDEILPHYQPIVSLESGEIVGFEALARWQHPRRGMVSPADFIPIAEETSLIIPIGMTMLQKACQQMGEWQNASLIGQEPTVSVNLSSRQFKKAGLLDDIKNILRDTGLKPSNLRLEVTESVVMEDVNSAADMLRHLQSMGVQISIDDFGTGYSSLSYLHRFPFDILKIDRSFVSRMNIDRESWGIVKTIVTLASELGKDIVAEGVESKEQREMLQSLGCKYGQGYFFSKPVDAPSAAHLLNNDNRKPRLPQLRLAKKEDERKFDKFYAA
ncbi:MAG TPA: EAL domain-containing protein [Pyrinomonadaceae bacterium]|nr:EAL domain-containing protein [Pyrinomonadaceae bacterium]